MFQLALRYAIAVFGIAVALGTARTVWVEPAVGELAAVAIEIPVLLGFSWLLFTAFAAASRPPPDLAGRLAVGATAFVILIAAELALSVLAFGQAPSAFFARWLQPAGALGLAGQIMFALIPALHARLTLTAFSVDS